MIHDRNWMNPAEPSTQPVQYICNDHLQSRKRTRNSHPLRRPPSAIHIIAMRNKYNKEGTTRIRDVKYLERFSDALLYQKSNL